MGRGLSSAPDQPHAKGEETQGLRLPLLFVDPRLGYESQAYGMATKRLGETV